MFQYTVRNLRGGFAPGRDVVIRTHDRGQALRWLDYSVRPRCLDRARYGLATMAQRAAATVQYGMLGARDRYLGART